LSNKAKAAKGRPSKFTSAQDTILRALRQGAPIRAACNIAAVCKSTYYGWLKLAEDNPESVYAKFAWETSQALASAEMELVNVIRKAAKHDWRAALALLERRWPTDYGRRVVRVVENRAPDAIPQLIVTERPAGYMPPGQHVS
jgi:hypothetical protein